MPGVEPLESMASRRITVILTFSCATLVGTCLFMAVRKMSNPTPHMREIGDAILSAAKLHLVLSNLSEDQVSTNWPKMVSLSGVALVPVGDVPCEFVTSVREGSNIISTNRTGTGGWFFDVGKKSLRLNWTNPVSFRLGRNTIVLPPDYFVIDQSGLRLSLGGESNTQLTAHLDDVRAKAELILKMLQPSRASLEQPLRTRNH